MGIAAGTHRFINIREGDTVIFSSSPIPGNQVSVNKTINQLFKHGANVITNSPFSDTHASGHAGQDEQKLMFKLMKPKYFMPIHGEYRMLKIHSKIGHMCGVKKGNEFVMDNGQVLALTKNSARISGQVHTGNVYIDGHGIGDIGNVVIKDRNILSKDGVLSAIVTISESKKKVIGDPVIISRGFIYMRENAELMDEMSKRVEKEITNKLARAKSININ